MDPLPDLDDLICVFEDEPRYAYEEDDRTAGHELDWREMWPYARVVFGLSRGPRRVSLDLQPGYEEVRLTVADGHGDVVDLLLRQVQSVEVDRAKGREVPKIGFADGLKTSSC
jgi:hypothetical protein